MTVELWRYIKGFGTDYEISSLGRVRSNRKKHGVEKRILKHKIMKRGYCRINLHNRDKSLACYLIHRLVATHFIKNPLNKSQVNHIDGNKQNNAISNLEWCNADENVLHGVANFLYTVGERNPHAKLTEENVLDIRCQHLNTLVSQRRLAAAYGVSRRTIRGIIKKETWKHI